MLTWPPIISKFYCRFLFFWFFAIDDGEVGVAPVTAPYVCRLFTENVCIPRGERTHQYTTTHRSFAITFSI